MTATQTRRIVGWPQRDTLTYLNPTLSIALVCAILVVSACSPPPSDADDSASWLTPRFEAKALTGNWSGTGISVADFNGDDVLDIVAAGATHPGVKAFQGLGGGEFDEVTGAWGLDGLFSRWAVLAWDMEGDGDIDLAFGTARAGSGENLFFANDGSGSFSPILLNVEHPCAWTETHGIAAADFDGDGDLDLGLSSGMDTSAGECSDVMLNDGEGTFSYAAVGTTLFHGCSSAAADIDGDGWQDLALGDLGDRSTVHWNRGDANLFDFDDPTINTVFPDQDQSMVLELLDYDQDGDLDLLVSSSISPALYRNDGDRVFTEVTEEAGVSGLAPVMNWTTSDIDGNGFPDILASQFWMGGVDARDHGEEEPEATLLMNTGEGSFINATATSGADTGWMVHGYGFGDLDKDGRLDLVLSQGAMTEAMDGPVQVMFNRGDVFPVLQIRLRGAGSNSEAVGAKVQVVTDVGSRYGWVRRGDAMGSSSGGDLRVGLGRATTIDDVVVTFTDGTVTQTGPIDMSGPLEVEIEHPL